MPGGINLTALLVMLGACVASFVALFWLFQKHIAGNKLLPYEPRIRVPWGGTLALLAILVPAVNFANTLWQMEFGPPDQAMVEEAIDADEADADPEDPNDGEPAEEDASRQFVANAWLTTLIMLGFVVVVMSFLQWTYKADSHDLGLPTSSSQLVRDVGIGLLAALAALMPIYALQVVLVLLLQPETQHPLIEQLTEHYSPGMLIAGFVTAVIAAPIYEEFSFRVLLQGWLEKVEDRRVDHRATLRPSPAMFDDSPSTIEMQEEARRIRNLGQSPPPVEEVEELAPGVLPFPQSQAAPPPRGMLDSLPHGWLPVLVSGTIFGLAHLGQGVAPIPLVLFGIVLGYLYQRTHRLAPCIVAHAVFNAFSMGMLWLHLG